MHLGLFIKKSISFLFEIFGLNNLLLNRFKNTNYIRILNYHDNHSDKIPEFKKQLEWYKKTFCNINYKNFLKFKTGALTLSNKPGLMITFDDGKKSNYTVAKDLLNEYGFTGYFFISPDLVGTKDYMSWEEIKQLQKEGHIIGSHTCTHHRFNESDNYEVLEYEIVKSKEKIQDATGEQINIFCWCGGEEKHYTYEAAKKIKQAGYKFSFMTNSYPVKPDTDNFHIQRSNIEDDWSLSLVKFQLSGLIDLKLKAKRNRVNELTNI